MLELHICDGSSGGGRGGGRTTTTTARVSHHASTPTTSRGRRRSSSTVIPDANNCSEESKNGILPEDGGVVIAKPEAGARNSCTGMVSSVSPESVSTKASDGHQSRRTSNAEGDTVQTIGSKASRSRSVTSTPPQCSDIERRPEPSHGARKWTHVKHRPSTSTSHGRRRQHPTPIDEYQRPVTSHINRQPSVELAAALSRSPLLPQASIPLAVMAAVKIGKGRRQHTRFAQRTAWNMPSELQVLDPGSNPHHDDTRADQSSTQAKSRAAAGADWSGGDQVSNVPRCRFLR